MTKSVSKVLTTSTVVAVAATAINQAEALNDRPHHNRLRTLQEGEDASTSTSLSMPTNVESISNLMEDEEPKFQEKKEKMDIGILMSSVMKNGKFADTVSQAFDEMGEWDKQDLVEKVDELVDVVKHLLHGSKSGKSKSGKTAKSGFGMNAAVESDYSSGYLGGLETSDYMSKSGKSESKSGKSSEGKIVLCVVLLTYLFIIVLSPILSYPHILSLSSLYTQNAPKKSVQLVLMVVKLLGLSHLIQFPVTVGLGHVVKTLTAMVVVSFVFCVLLSAFL